MLQALRPRRGADLQQLQMVFEEEGWHAALPSSMPDRLLLALARDLRVLEMMSDRDGQSLRLVGPMFAAMYLMLENPGRSFGAGQELHISWLSLSAALNAYQCAIEREIVSRITGFSSGADMKNLLRALETLREGSWSEEGAVRVLKLFREASLAGESVPVWIAAKLIGCTESHLLETHRRFGNPILCESSLQSYLCGLMAVTSNLCDMTQSLETATAWLRSYHIPEFDGLTAMEVVAAGRGADLARLIDIYAAGPAG